MMSIHMEQMRSDIYVDFDPTVYGELEANKSEQVEWLDKAWWIAPKQKMDIMGLEIPIAPNVVNLWVYSFNGVTNFGNKVFKITI